MLATVKDASRRFQRSPAAILDRGSARRGNSLRPRRGNAAQPNKETSLRSRHIHFADIDRHNSVGTPRFGRRFGVDDPSTLAARALTPRMPSPGSHCGLISTQSDIGLNTRANNPAKQPARRSRQTHFRAMPMSLTLFAFVVLLQTATRHTVLVKIRSGRKRGRPTSCCQCRARRKGVERFGCREGSIAAITAI